MKYLAFFGISFFLAVAGAEVSTSVPISEGKNELRVNTADYYSWNTRTELYSFKHIKVSEFSHIVKNCISTYGKIQINDKLNMIIITDEPNKLKDILALCTRLDTPAMEGFEKIQTQTIPINFSVASAILPFVRDYLSVEGDVKSNDVLNFISVTDHPDVISRITTEIAKFDLPPKQIVFKFHIVEVYRDNAKEAGTDWNKLFNIVDGNASYTRSSETEHGSNYPANTPDQTTRHSRFNSSIGIDTRNLSDFIKLMSENKTINLVAENSLLCINNSPSTFTFHYQGKTVSVTMKPTAVNNKTLLLRTKILSDNETLLDNATLSEIGNPNLLLRLTINDSQTGTKEVPVIGTVLPFLFSRHSKSSRVASIDIVCTPVMQILK